MNIKSNPAAGFIVPNVMAVVIVGASKFLVDHHNDNILIFGDFIIVPLLMGLISAWFWRHLELSGGKLTAYSCYNTLIAIFLSYVFLREGVICLLIVSPLLMGGTIAGAFLGREVFGRNNQRLNISVVSLLVVVFIADSLSTHHYENMVSDTVVIEAPPEKVWQYVVAYERIKQPEKYWLFKAGMPSPVQSTVTGYRQGAGRKCIFSNGYVFDEKMVTFQPNHNLTFDITHQPKDPEIMGHIDILQGQFILKRNGNGSTTLIGNSWYRLYVFPVWYYDLWA